MTEPNGHRTLNQWMIHLDEKLDEFRREVLREIKSKADQEDHNKLETRVEKVEEKTNRLISVKDGLWGALLVASHWVKSNFFN